MMQKRPTGTIRTARHVPAWTKSCIFDLPTNCHPSTALARHFAPNAVEGPATPLVLANCRPISAKKVRLSGNGYLARPFPFRKKIESHKSQLPRVQVHPQMHHLQQFHPIDASSAKLILDAWSTHRRRTPYSSRAHRGHPRRLHLHLSAPLHSRSLWPVIHPHDDPSPLRTLPSRKPLLALH